MWCVRVLQSASLRAPKCVKLCVPIWVHSGLVKPKMGTCVCACTHAHCECVRTIRKWTFIFLADWFSRAFFNGFVFRCWAASSYIFHDILRSSCQQYFSSFHLPETSISYFNCLFSSLLHHCAACAAFVPKRNTLMCWMWFLQLCSKKLESQVRLMGQKQRIMGKRDSGASVCPAYEDVQECGWTCLLC